MLRDHAKLVQFIAVAGQIDGRKKLQKMIYIAKKSGYPFQEKYGLHMYGPYSEELTCRIEELCELGFVEETVHDKGSYVQYCYTPTEEGLHFAETIVPESFIEPTFVEALTSQRSRFLELVSTLLYFDRLNRKEQVEKVRVVKNKLNFTDEEFTEAFRFIDSLVQ